MIQPRILLLLTTIGIKLGTTKAQCQLINKPIYMYQCTFTTENKPTNKIINIPNNRYNRYNNVSVIFTSSYIQSLTDVIKLPTTSHNLIYLTVTRSKLKTIGYNALKTFPKLLGLNLSQNIIERLNPLDLNGLEQLTSLNISRNNINFIDNLTFGDQTTIQVLDLSHNALSSINNSHFNSTHFLQFLDLSHNAITIIERYAFVGLINLVKLNLSGNKITTLDHQFAHLGSLQELQLSGNRLVVITGVFLSLESMERLDLSGNGMVNISWDQFGALKVLDVSYNRISDFNMSALKIGALKNISIHGNVFTCNNLLSHIGNFKVAEVVVIQGPDLHMVNVFGIGCNISGLVMENGTCTSGTIREFESDMGVLKDKLVVYGMIIIVLLVMMLCILLLIVVNVIMGNGLQKRSIIGMFAAIKQMDSL